MLNGSRHLVAAYTLLNGSRPAPAEILTLLRTNLPLHSRPRLLRAIATMPRNANGKIDHRSLETMHAAMEGMQQSAATELLSNFKFDWAGCGRSYFDR